MIGACLPLLLVLSAAQGPDPDVTRIETRKLEFPISADRAQVTARDRIHLHISWDRGKTWELAAIATAGDEVVRFTADRDGLAWFAVQVIDKNGKAEPRKPGGAGPDQKVLIDTCGKDQVARKADLSKDTVEALRARIAELEARQRELEKRLERLEKRQPPDREKE